ncbi:MAG: response regulator transcription factor [Lachnospiraceae bacterium]|nr:response regulator transcription factor [Lachnospiraceae bacterium]
MESISDTTKNDRKVLIVEDDELLNDGLCYHLQKNGYHPVPAYTLEQADTLLETEAWELFLLDINFPDGNGLRFAKELRKHSPAPIMFLTAQDMDEDVIRGFEAGADDYITKPFNIKILMQRIQAVLKRYHLSQTPTSSPADTKDRTSISFGSLNIDFEAMTVTKNNVPLILTPTEFKLLVIFCRHPGQILTIHLLWPRLWDQDGNFVDEHTLTINISRLRKKIEDEDDSYIKTVYGMGYQWIKPACE